MRQLTASEKIAILENRVAQLEKQAFIEGIKAKVYEAMYPFKKLVPQTRKIAIDSKKDPKQIAKGYMKVRKNPEFKKVAKQVQKEAGSSPVAQIAYIIKAYNQKDEAPLERTASARWLSYAALTILGKSLGVSWAAIAFFLIVHVSVEWVVNKVKGIFKSGSIDKEAGLIDNFIILSTLIAFLFGIPMGIKQLKQEKSFRERFINSLLSPYVEDIKIVNLRRSYAPNNFNAPNEFNGYVFLNGEKFKIEVLVFDEYRNASLKIDNEQLYYGRMIPPKNGEVEKFIIERKLRNLGVIQ